MLGGGLQTAGHNVSARNLEATLWSAFLADGQHTLLDISEKTGTPFKDIVSIVLVMVEQGLLRLDYSTENFL